jgi:hypothetical protein
MLFGRSLLPCSLTLVAGITLKVFGTWGLIDERT